MSMKAALHSAFSAPALCPQPVGIKQGRRGPLQFIAFAMALAGLFASTTSATAQPLKPVVPASAPAAGKAAVSGPAWSELKPAQQQALAPLASSWNTSMSEGQKRKWLEISKNYSAMTPEDQATLNSRMTDWVNLSPQQRAQARLNFGKTKELSRQLTPDEKKAKWEAYQALSPEEKQKLAEKASPKPSGAATAVRPVAPQKLATIPAQAASKPVTKPAPKINAPIPAASAATAASPTSAASAGASGTAPQR